MFPKCKYIVANLVFFHLGFWSGNFFLIAPFPDHSLLKKNKFQNLDLKLRNDHIHKCTVERFVAVKILYDDK